MKQKESIESQNILYVMEDRYIKKKCIKLPEQFN